MSDDHATIAQLKQEVQQFVEERRWNQFHLPKNLAMALSIEAAELMEHFQWLTPEQADQSIRDPERRREIADELADVFCYLLTLASCMELDLADAFRAKMVKNRQKYPVDVIRGRYGHDDPADVQRW